jgi:hypothetical protein
MNDFHGLFKLPFIILLIILFINPSVATLNSIVKDISLFEDSECSESSKVMQTWEYYSTSCLVELCIPVLPGEEMNYVRI